MMFGLLPGDLQTTTEITFLESYTGTERSFVIEEDGVCPTCQGNPRQYIRRCAECGGTGAVRTKQRIAVTIPAGVEDGVNVRVKNQGQRIGTRGKRGNLYVTVKVKPDAHYSRQGAHLHMTLEIEQAILDDGGSINIPLPDGQQFTINIPWGQVQDGGSLHVPQRGMPVVNTQRRGDLYIRVRAVPKRVRPKSTPPPSPAKPPAPAAAKPTQRKTASSARSGSGRTRTPKAAAQLPAAPPSPVQSSSPQKHERLGTQLGNYRILRHLGSGGFADVYFAEHVYLQTPAAIKVLREQMKAAESEEFLREARIVAGLKHPHIVRVLDFGLEAGASTPYLIMEYAPDGTLADRHPEGTQVPVETVVSYINQLAQALNYAHEQKIIHRDVKPANMLLEGDRLLLSDFGIAVAAHTTQSLATQEAIGTVTYMAPEQIRKKPRLASDQYALAVVAYEWLAGEAPFTGAPIEVAMSHLSDEPPSLCARRSDLSPELEQVLFRALAKDPEQRYPDVMAFAEAFQQIKEKEE